MRHTPRRGRAANACCLAISLTALGRRDEAARWLDRARANDPACLLLPEAEAAVAPGGIPQSAAR